MSIDTHADGSDAPSPFLERARANQARLVDALQPHYDFVVCGAGSSGSVVARRLAENPTSASCWWRRAAMTTCQA